MDVTEENIVKYEEYNKGSGFRAFVIPANVVNKFEVKFPVVYSDRGIFKINE